MADVLATDTVERAALLVGGPLLSVLFFTTFAYSLAERGGVLRLAVAVIGCMVTGGFVGAVCSPLLWMIRSAARRKDGVLVGRYDKAQMLVPFRQIRGVSVHVYDGFRQRAAVVFHVESGPRIDIFALWGCQIEDVRQFIGLLVAQSGVEKNLATVGPLYALVDIPWRPVLKSSLGFLVLTAPIALWRWADGQVLAPWIAFAVCAGSGAAARYARAVSQRAVLENGAWRPDESGANSRGIARLPGPVELYAAAIRRNARTGPSEDE